MSNNYCRLTAYYPAEDISCIMDTYGKYDEIWQFSAYLVKLKFKIIDVAGKGQFEYGNIPPIKEKSNQFILRACAKGKGEKIDGVISINGRNYKTFR